VALKLGDLVAYLKADDGPLRAGLANAKTRVSAFGDSLKTGLKAAGGAAAAGMGAAIATGLAQNLDIGAGRAKLTAQLDLTKEESAKYGELAGKVYAGNYGESLTAVNDAIKSVVHNVGDVGTLGEEGFQKATEAALTLSDTMGVDVGATTEAVAKMIRNGLVKTPEEAFNVLTKGFTDGADRSGDFLETINEYSPQFAKLGIDGDTALSMINAGLRAGARDTDVIADAFKEFSLLAIDKTSDAGKAFKALGLDAQDTRGKIAAGGDGAREMTNKVIDQLNKVKDPVKRNKLGIQLFGTQWEDTMRQILPAMDGVLEKSEDVTGATDRMTAAAGDSGAARIETFRRGIETWIQTQTSASGAMGTTVAGFAEFGPGALTAAGSIGMMVSGLAALNAGAALTAVRTGIVTVATGAWTAAQWLLNTALTMNPIGIVIMLIVALVAGIVIAYKKSETFRKIVQGAMKGVVKAFGWLHEKAKEVWSWLKGAFSKAKDYITAPIRIGIRKAIDHFQDMNRKAREIPGKIKDAFSKANTLLASAGRNVVIGLWDGIRGMGGWLWDKVYGFMTSAIPGPVKKALGIASPSKVGRMLGGYFGQGVGLGIDDERRGVEQAATRLAMSAVPSQGALASIPRQRTGAGAAGAAGGPAVVEFRGEQAFVDFMRKIVNVNGGGSVQVAFGTSRGGALAGAR
jgi:phage-related minor tail protein